MVNPARAMLLRFAPMIYGPTVLFALGEGAVIPLIPVLATNLGADLATAGLVASALVVGQLCGNFPAGWLVMRLGERLTMAIAGTVALLGVLGLVFAPNVGLLSASVFLIGMCAAAFALARHAFMTAKVPFSFRARALALLGGSFRLGMFIGPFLAAALLGLTGTGTSAAWCFAVCLLASVLLVLLGPDPEQQIDAEARNERAAQADVLRAHADTGEAVTGTISLPQPPRSGRESGGSPGQLPVIGNSNNTRGEGGCGGSRCPRGCVPHDGNTSKSACETRRRGGVTLCSALGATGGAAAVGVVNWA